MLIDTQKYITQEILWIHCPTLNEKAVSKLRVKEVIFTPTPINVVKIEDLSIGNDETRLSTC